MPARSLFHSAVSFLIGFGVLFAACSAYYEVRVIRSDNLLKQFAYVRQESLQPEVVFFGDSHPAMDVRTDAMGGRYFNFAFPSFNLREAYLKVQFILQHKPRVRAFVVPADDHIFSVYRSEDRNFAPMLHLVTLRDVWQVYQFRPLDMLTSLATYVAPLSNPIHRQEFVRVLKKDISSLFTGELLQRDLFWDGHCQLTLREGKEWSTLPEGQREETAASRVQVQLQDPLVNQELVRALRSLLALAEEHGVAVIGVRYPIVREYQDRARLMDIASVRAVQSKLPFRAILDYQQLYDDRQNLFQDEDHLNETGAILFSRRLARDLEALLP
ncbi:MAG: hypothetical protein PHH13_01140 [Candidatus Peribacteraceae bacterium]|nr:hypothetical protein [Candidatus Peribacteraceae bacterium]